MMDILVPETCSGNKTAYFVASSWFFTFNISVRLLTRTEPNGLVYSVAVNLEPAADSLSIANEYKDEW
jgi:hypothetical protein